MSIEENKAFMRRWHDEMNRHNLDGFDDLMTDDDVECNTVSPQPIGRAATEQLMAQLGAASSASTVPVLVTL